MISAEVQRIILLVGLAVTGYLTLLAWNEDYNGHSPSSQSTTQPQLSSDLPNVDSFDVTQTPANDLAASGVLESNAIQQNINSDLPDASSIPGSAPVANAANIPVATQSSDSRLVQVKTDSLDFWIDLLGGDIVRVRLPKHPVSIDVPDDAFTLLDQGNGRTYVGQTGLIEPAGNHPGILKPLFTTTNNVLEMSGSTLQLVLTAKLATVEVEKVFTFTRESYLVDIEYRVKNLSDLPFRASLFAQLKRDGQDPAGEESFALGPRPYVGAAVTTEESRYEKIDFDDLEEGPYKHTVNGGWVAMLQHYFLSAFVPDAGTVTNQYGDLKNGLYRIGFTSAAQEVAPHGSGAYHVRFYAGPKNQKVLEGIAENLNLTVDYGFLWWIAIPLFTILDWVHDNVAANWGVAIILLTVFVKLLLYPLFSKSFRSMANMRRVSPQMKRLQERYKDDRQKLSQEMMALYKKEKVNPLGGCLPMLLPMPIFLALYWVLFESYELRQAPFMLWINDLSAMDPFFVLPLLMGGSMFLQQSMAPAVGDPMQAKMMKMMPIMFTVLFLFFPAGLVLYWLVNNVLSIAQQKFVNYQMDAKLAQK